MAMNGQTHGMRMNVYLDVPGRFICKLALGFGALFLAPEFQGSADAELLRAGLWTQGAEERSKLRIHGRMFLGESDPFGRMPVLDGCHLLIAMPDRGRLALILRLSGAESHCILVASEPRFWAGTFLEVGAVWVIAPGLKRCVGPVALPDYIADAVGRGGGGSPRDPRLVELESMLAQVPPRPPID
jgi:hypothetical protein